MCDPQAVRLPTWLYERRDGYVTLRSSRQDYDEDEALPAWLELLGAVAQFVMVLALAFFVLGLVVAGTDAFLHLERSGAIRAWIEEHLWQ